MNTRSIRFRLTVWYAALLALSLGLFGTFVYVGLARYLSRSLETSLIKEARQIGETLLANVRLSGDAYVVDEVKEHFAPEINGRFIRITRFDGSVLYMSGPPKDKSFDPSGLPTATADRSHEGIREVVLPGDTELVIYTLPFTATDGSRFLIETGMSDRDIDNTLEGLLTTFVIVLPLLVAAAIGGGYLLMRHSLKPVDEITKSATQITSHNLGERLPVTQTGDELERLSTGLNGMIARLEESFHQINRFSADASHELRTPLTILRGELETIIRRGQVDNEDGETIGSALEEIERLSKIVESLLAITRLDAGEAQIERVSFDLTDLAVNMTDQMRFLAEDKNITLKHNTSVGVQVAGDRSRVQQVVLNLLDNAIKYTPPGGSVEVKVSRENGHGVLEVSDNGSGIPAEALSHVFDRFYRVDKARSRQMGGAGLGLSIVKSICEAHGGQVSVQSQEGRGSCFRVELPIKADDSQSAL